jgi:hypothetical protein
MTQAELAGGMANAPQAHPEKGQLIRDFTLTSTLGQPISLSDYRGRSNLVLIFAGDGDNSPNLKMLTKITADYDQFMDEQTQVLLCSVLRGKQPELSSKRTCPFLCWSMRMGEYIAPRALSTTTVTLPQQFISLTDSVRCLLCTERQKGRRYPAPTRLSNG